MAKNPSTHQQKIVSRYYEHHDTIQSNKLGDLVSELWLCEDAKTQAKLWGKAQIALMRMGVDATSVARIVGNKDMEGLAQLVAQADGAGSSSGAADAPRNPAPGMPGHVAPPRLKSVADGRTIKQMQAQKAAEGGYDSLEEDNLKRALRAFRKKLKTLRRDDESRLGHRCTTSGRVSAIAGITPPSEYPSPIWEKLAETGRLKKAGQGTFTLP